MFKKLVFSPLLAISIDLANVAQLTTGVHVLHVLRRFLNDNVVVNFEDKQ